ncbi:MAG: hypothetical protein JRH01_08700 [Deltaproteobacteria bacterium]|nr:hypothetical protein [Deltaproteobacteria bacterium]MBW2397075.1 hypothetical protein [Deltaproteobacteria bacterium]
MSDLYFKVVNPIVKSLLKSPLHGLMSKNTVLLEFKGRKSAKTYTTPISYHFQAGKLHCFSNKSFGWWRNLIDAEQVSLTWKGKQVLGKPTVVIDQPEVMQKALTDFLIAVPRDAEHSGVALDSAKQPMQRDVAEAVPNMVYISIELLQ